jgi:CBS-domain-containing membrane protein
MNIKDCMKRNVISISEKATVREAASIIKKKHIGLLPVVDDNNNIIGVVGLRDLLELELPDFIRFVADVDFVHDFGAVENTRPTSEILDGPITILMKDAITVDHECGLLRAYALMLQYNLHDMPVVSGSGELLGIASRVDIGTSILATWEQVA